MQQVVVTGAGGAIGSALVPLLRASGYDVLALGRENAPLPWSGWYDPDRPPVAILHLAADSQARAATDAASTAAPHLALFADLAAKGWRGHLVFLSSAAVYAGSDSPIPETTPPAPANSYGFAKLAVEQGLIALAGASGLALSVLRVANVYGSPQDLRRRRVTGLLIDAARRGTPFTVLGDGTSRRDYLHVDDLCRGILAILRIPPRAGTARVLNLGSGTATSLTRLIALVEAATGKHIAVTPAPVAAEAASNVLDVTLAARLLDWRPQITLEAGLARLARDLPAP